MCAIDVCELNYAWWVPMGQTKMRSTLIRPQNMDPQRLEHVSNKTVDAMKTNQWIGASTDIWRTSLIFSMKVYFLRVILTTWNSIWPFYSDSLCDILSDIYFDILSGTWHSICYIFGDSLWSRSSERPRWSWPCCFGGDHCDLGPARRRRTRRRTQLT